MAKDDSADALRVESATGSHGPPSIRRETVIDANGRSEKAPSTPNEARPDVTQTAFHKEFRNPDLAGPRGHVAGPWAIQCGVLQFFAWGRIVNKISFLLLSPFLFLATSVPWAQAPGQQQEPPHQSQRLADGGLRQVLISILIPSLPAAPFTAIVRTEWIRRLPDGSSITLKSHRAIARDAAGRIFQERRTLVPDDGKSESGISQIEISDPVLHRLYICVPRELVCQLKEFSAAPFADAPVTPSTPKHPGAATEEDLGKQSISGLETVGTRETTVIPTGQIGNNSPIATRRESWYSPQLGVNLISKQEDPRFGVQNFEVTDIILGDPDSKLFEVPAGSKILDLRKPPEICGADMEHIVARYLGASGSPSTSQGNIGDGSGAALLQAVSTPKSAE